MNIFIYIGIGAIVVIAVGVLVGWNAPVGYEDENGFHLGKEEDKK
jgi:hypothetical protein